MNTYRQIIVSKIKFYEKMSRKTRRSALRHWNSGASNMGAYQSSLKIADNYDDLVMQFTKALKECDEEMESPR